METKNKKTYEGTILDNINPEKTISILDTLLSSYGKETWYTSPDEVVKFEPHFSEPEIDALRHYIGMQALSDKFGPTVAKLLGDLNEYPFNPRNEGKVVDKANNQKAIDDFKKGIMFDPKWLNTVKWAQEPNATAALDSLLKELIIPPKGGDYE